MAVTYSVFVDWDYSGTGAPDFSQPADDITSYVMGCSGNIGIGKETAQLADVGKCSLTLRNTDRRFSPAYSGGALYGKLTPGKPVKVIVVDGSNYDWFRGEIKSIMPSAGGQATGTNGVKSDRLCRIECVDNMERLRRTRIATPLLRSRYGHELITAAINKALNAPAATGTVSLNGQVSNNDWVQINTAINGINYGIRYTFKTSLGSAANEVLIGATVEETIDNLRNAINGGPGAGTTYTAATVPLEIATAAPVGSYYRKVLEDEPIRYHRLSEPSGTNADDLGGNSADATYVGAPTLGATGLVTGDNATSFSGSGQYVSIPTLDMSNRAFSVEFLISPSASPPANQDIFSIYGAWVAGQASYLRLFSTGDLTYDAYLTGGSISTPAGVIGFAGGTYHVVLTYDPVTDESKIYVNSTAQASGSAGPYSGTALPVIQFGAFTAAGGNPLKGVGDEFALYFKVLTPERVAAHYAARLTTPGVLITAAIPGAVGNGIALTVSGANLSVSSAFLAGGIDYPTSPANSFESAGELIPFAGDDWQSDNTNALTAVTDVVKNEGTGLFWAAKDGAYVFKNQGYIFRQGAASASLTLSSEQEDVEITGGEDDLYNNVEVTIKPRETKSLGVVGKINAPVQIPGRWGTERWDGNSPISLTEQGMKVIKVQFADPETGLRCAATNLVLPLLPTTNYEIYETVGDPYPGYTNGDPATGKLYVFFSVAVNATSAEVSVVNKALGPLYITKLEISGLALVKYNPYTAVAEDASSQQLYGKRTLTIQLPLSNNQQFAEALAAYNLKRYKDASFRAKRISFASIMRTIGGVKLHSLNLGDVISYTDYQHGVSAQKYLTRGIQWTFGSPASGRMAASFDVFRLDDSIYGAFDAGAPRGKFNQAKFGL